MKVHLNLTTRLVLIFVLFAAILLGSVAALAYTSGRAGLQEAATAELLATAFEKRSAFERWLTEARIDVTAQAASPLVVEQAALLLSAAAGSPQAQAAHDILVREFQPTVGPETAFIDLLFIEAETGEVLASTDPNEEGKFKENLSYFINGKIKPYVSEVFYSTSLGRPAIAAAAPVVAADGRVLGVLAGRLDMNILNSLIAQRTGLRHSDDSYLVNAAGLLVTQPRFMPESVVLQNSIRTVVTDRCLDANSGVGLYDDYRGVAVIGAYRWLPAYRVCLITEFDQSEAFAASQSFGNTVVWVFGLALVLSVALAFALARTFTRPILALQTGAARLGQGDLESRVAVKSSDEIGRLAAAFNAMAASLKQQLAERQLAQQRITDALEFNTTLIDASTLGLSAYDAAGQCILANDAIARMVGATRAQVLGQNYNHIASWKKSGLLDAARQALTSDAETRQEFHTTSSFGKDMWLDCRFVPFDASGEHHLLLITDDISARKQAEATLRAYATVLEQSNRDLEEFAYIASHDLQEPLRKIMAFSDRLTTRYGGAFDDTGRDYLERLHAAAQRMQTLVNDLLVYSRLSSPTQSLSQVDLTAAAHEVLTGLQGPLAAAGGQAQVGELPAVEADPAQMRQLLQNLVANALKFRRPDAPPLIRIEGRRAAPEQVQVLVTDNGIGFDEKYLDRIFKPFQRLHGREEYAGTGMGLAICRRIVERHGGTITATSTPGAGSTFIVTLPIRQTRQG